MIASPLRHPADISARYQTVTKSEDSNRNSLIQSFASCIYIFNNKIYQNLVKTRPLLVIKHFRNFLSSSKVLVYISWSNIGGSYLDHFSTYRGIHPGWPKNQTAQKVLYASLTATAFTLRSNWVFCGLNSHSTKCH